MRGVDPCSLTVLALTVWREARGESQAAREAVAGVVMERAAHPGWWGRTPYGICTRPLQFSAMTAPSDPQLGRWPREDDPAWRECLGTASDALAGRLQHPFPGADSYHDTSIPPPHWATPGRFCGQLGRLRFYRVGPGGGKR